MQGFNRTASPLSNLPPRSGRLIGRARDRAAVARLLLQARARLLTLVGPPGVGKTRLAIEAAHTLPASVRQDVCFIDLTATRDPTLVIPAIGRVLGLRGRVSLPKQVERYLRARNPLLILDNLEQLPAAAGIVSSLLTACPALRILATSQSALRLPWEYEFPVTPMRLPDLASLPPIAALSKIPAVALFLERARAAAPGFTLADETARPVAEICVALDGLPLAIELAAARMRVLSVTEIATRLGDCFHLLTGGHARASRHRALYTAIQWSVDLLSDRERRLLLLLSVFDGGAPLEAVQAICTGQELGPESVLDLLTSLRDKSLIISHTAGPHARYRMLETVRQFAREKFDGSPASREICNRHLHWYLDFVERTGREACGPSQIEWLRRLEVERPNVMAAFQWAMDTQQTEVALRIAAALATPGFRQGHYAEMRDLLDRALAHSPGRGHAHLSAQIHRATLGWVQADLGSAAGLAEDALSRARDLGHADLVGSALHVLGLCFDAAGDEMRATAAWEEALQASRQVGARALEASCLMNLARAARHRGHYTRASRLAVEGLQLARSLGDRWLISMVSRVLGQILLAQGKPADALAPQLESLLAARDLGDRSVMGWALYTLAEAAFAAGHAEQATVLLAGYESMRRTLEFEAAVPYPAYAARHRRFLHGLQHALGRETFARAKARGARMSVARVVKFAVRSARTVAAAPAARFVDSSGPLSKRERDVVRLITRGLSTRDIARTLYIGERTVETHVTHILNKLGFSSRTQIAAWGAEQALH